MAQCSWLFDTSKIFKIGPLEAEKSRCKDKATKIQKYELILPRLLCFTYRLGRSLRPGVENSHDPHHLILKLFLRGNAYAIKIIITGPNSQEPNALESII